MFFPTRASGRCLLAAGRSRRDCVSTMTDARAAAEPSTASAVPDSLRRLEFPRQGDLGDIGRLARVLALSLRVAGRYPEMSAGIEIVGYGRIEPGQRSPRSELI